MGQGGLSLYFSCVPVTKAVHVQRLLGQLPALWQRGHPLAPPLQVPNGLLGHSQLLLLCLWGSRQWGLRPGLPRTSPTNRARGLAFMRMDSRSAK